MDLLKTRHGWSAYHVFYGSVLVGFFLILSSCFTITLPPPEISQEQEAASSSIEASLSNRGKQLADAFLRLKEKTLFQKFHNLIWFFDSVLLVLVMLLSVGIITLGLRKQILETRRKQTMARLKKDIQSLARKGPSAFKTALPILATKMSPSEFVEIAKDWGAIIPTELEEHFRNHLFSSGKIKEIEQSARGGRNKSRRIKAIACLGYAASPSAVEILKEALGDKDKEISYVALLALSRIRNRESARILLNFLGEHAFSGQKLISLLENFPPDIIEEVIQATENPDSRVRFWAVKLLSKYHPVAQWKKVAQLTEDDSPNVRAAACECLGVLKRREAKSVLIKCLHDRVWFVRMQAVRALSKILGPESTPDLIQLMAKDSSPLVKDSVKNAIIGDIERALPYIEQCLRGGDEEAKRHCINALIDSNYIVEILAGVLSDDLQIRKQAAHLLEGLVKTRVYFGLKKMLEVFVPSSRDKILKVLSGIDPALAMEISSRSVEKV